ncbi:glycosyltransferase family 2 protein [Sphingomonas ginkgonis]|uniref:Glycosyltransferase family 2 protein n=1 Tax=Sphingomonas ginkgonis TaxID=2315330 RepID=A0A3S0ENP7_9SPHN|nr:glycosyltransferase family A protein [Sphingomonas ginkgonis]RST31731.1 glycosyltransferase family 2 protein [Sphingomonas ginkgonis]
MTTLTIILPYFNEQGWIGPTIDSLVAQGDERFELLLVDNGSTDDSAREAFDYAAPLGERVHHLVCTEPGKTAALAFGLAHAASSYVATCDADTLYPPDYVARVIETFERHPDGVAVMAVDLYAPVTHPRSRRRERRIIAKGRRHPRKCHAGGYAQAFRRSALLAAGGFCRERWPYVLEDHEVVARLIDHGRLLYPPGHVCFPSARRHDRRSVNWTPLERLAYRFVPAGASRWFFHRFLGPRLARRRAIATALREKSW